MRTSRICVVALAACCAGCAAAPERTFKVTSETPSMIRINFDPWQASPDKIFDTAQAHCAKFGRRAMAQPSTETTFGLREMVFLCRTPGS